MSLHENGASPEPDNEMNTAVTQQIETLRWIHSAERYLATARAQAARAPDDDELASMIVMMERHVQDKGREAGVRGAAPCSGSGQ
jgi:hypothetical protein